jgi:hypothetical protein
MNCSLAFRLGFTLLWATSQIAQASPHHDLLQAIRNGQIEVIEDLIQHGANLEFRDENGETPLFCAVESGNIDVVRRLLSYGTKVNVDQNLPNPLDEALFTNKLQIARELMLYGARPSKYHPGHLYLLNQGKMLSALIAMNREAVLQLLSRVDPPTLLKLIEEFLIHNDEGVQSAPKVYSRFLLPLQKEIRIQIHSGRNPKTIKEEAYQRALGLHTQRPTPPDSTQDMKALVKDAELLDEIIRVYRESLATWSLKTHCLHALGNGFRNAGRNLNDDPTLRPAEVFETKESLFSNIDSLRARDQEDYFDCTNVPPGMLHHARTLKHYIERSAKLHFRD